MHLCTLYIVHPCTLVFSYVCSLHDEEERRWQIDDISEGRTLSVISDVGGEAASGNQRAEIEKQPSVDR